MDAQQSTAALGLAEAAELAGCSRDTIRRAAQRGELKAEMGPGVRGPQWWISESDLLEWRSSRDMDAEQSSAAQQGYAERSTAAQYAEHSAAAQQRKVWRSSAQQEAEWTASRSRIPDQPFSVSPEASASTSPPAEVYIALIDRLSRAERRSVELELQLRQSQRLLSENAESITEKEALAKEAAAKLQAGEETRQAEFAHLSAQLVDAQTREIQAREAEAQLRAAEEEHRAENERLRAELESTRQQLTEASKKPSGLLAWLGLRK